ncbi:MAG TPA: roadblock/LC7 domain-containing protein [Anaeromyxobacter sp.]|nr:roadblock/LC7 domain-containing protein [Anaeromyxobacter sp.]
MQSVLNQLVTVPGVVGGMVYDADGGLLSKTFPPLFDDTLLANAARVLVDGAAGLETVTGKVGMLDMRFADARIVVRPMAGAHLVLVCAAQTNLQLLNISTSVAVPKLERLVAAMGPLAEPEPTLEDPEPEEPEPPPVLAAPSRKEAKAAKKAAKAKQEKPPPEEDPGFFHW